MKMKHYDFKCNLRKDLKGMFSLKGKLALVTGSSRGIGSAIAKSLAEAGADIILHCRSNVTECEKVQAEILKMGVKCDYITADTSKPEDIEKMFNFVKEKYGHLDILVNNAAVLSRTPFLELTVDEWNWVMETNSRGYFLCMQNAAKLMLDRGAGRIINISSISQYEAAENRTHYCASKGAIGMLTKSSALELARYGITVNAVLPGSIHTDFNNDVLSDPEFYESCRQGIPLKRLGKADDIGGAVTFLATDEASYVTGAEIVVDGGKLL